VRNAHPCRPEAVVGLANRVGSEELNKLILAVSYAILVPLVVGWYAANDGSVRSKGTMYFVMHPHGISATGRWVELSYDGNIITGRSSMARTETDARELVGELKEQDASGSR
jgi:hypothetical protein